MEVIICGSAEEAGRLGAAKVASVVAHKPAAVLGLATGSSPLAIYADLRRRVEAGELDLSQAYGFALDEYVGLPREHEQSYLATITRTVTEPLRLDPTRVRVPDGAAADIEAACDDYEAAIAAAGGVDIQILGIGGNGHIGFNEPTSSLASRTRIKTLTPQTRADNARFFSTPDEVPTHCVTQGLGTIMAARQVLLVAQGERKAAAVAACVEGPVSALCPASVLQFHPQATIIIDEGAARDLGYREYYRHAYANKPEWQRFADADVEVSR